MVNRVNRGPDSERIQQFDIVMQHERVELVQLVGPQGTDFTVDAFHFVHFFGQLLVQVLNSHIDYVLDVNVRVFKEV